MRKLTGPARRLLSPQTSSPLKDEAHWSRMISVTAAMPREFAPYTAAVFLLSADAALWKQSRQAICKGCIDFNRVRARGVGLDGYTLDNMLAAYHEGKQIAIHRLSYQKRDIVANAYHYRRLTVKQSFDIENTLLHADNMIDSLINPLDLSRYDEVLYE